MELNCRRFVGFVMSKIRGFIGGKRARKY